MREKISKVINLKVIMALTGGGLITSCVGAFAIYLFVVPKLPSIDSLKDIQFQVPLRVYTSDNKLIAEFGKKKRSPVNIDEVPPLMINAVLAAEDDRFYEHPGVDYKGLLRAVIYLAKTGEKGQGGSTITMQVARNFFLTFEKTYLRKLNEILLSFKIEDELTKKEILELYLNKIFLGNRAYGYAAAAQVYYGLKLDELTPAQAAMLAGLPKAPSRYNPIVNPKRARIRRNYVLGRMRALNMLTELEYQKALEEIDKAEMHGLSVEVAAPYVAEMVRKEMLERYGDDAYSGGYRVYTSLDSRLQLAANRALQKALMEYEERHGFRGAESHVELSEEATEEEFRALLSEFRTANHLLPALVTQIGEKKAILYQRQYGLIDLEWEGMDWAAPWRGDGRSPGSRPKRVSDFLQRGDVVRVYRDENRKWRLGQIPAVEGALVSLSPQSGKLLALVGGFNFSKSNFNRVLQAERQPGSNIKPFNYSAALAKGYSAASLINDAPIVFEDSSLETAWRPTNAGGKVYGPTRLREALVKSRNLVSIRLLNAIGIPYAINYAERFGFDKSKLPRDLSLALGSVSITPWQLVSAYAIFANGGYKVEPYFIERVENTNDEVVFKANPKIVCPECEREAPQMMDGEPTPESGMQNVSLSDEANDQSGLSANSEQEGLLEQGEMTTRVAERVIDPENAYIMTSMMREVIQRGTGQRAKQLGRPDIAGKTGTTNDQKDAWFSGFNPDVVTTAWVGFDDPHTLGEREYGGRAALPMWIYYMKEALKGIPVKPFDRPAGLVSVRVDSKLGCVVSAGSTQGQFEVFRINNVPERCTEGSYEYPSVGGGDTPATQPGEEGRPIREPTEAPEELF